MDFCRQILLAIDPVQQWQVLAQGLHLGTVSTLEWLLGHVFAKSAPSHRTDYACSPCRQHCTCSQDSPPLISSESQHPSQDAR